MNAPHQTQSHRSPEQSADKLANREVATLVEVGRIVIDHLRRRSEFLPGAVFADPQWLMTLELFIAAEENRSVSVSSLGLSSGVPATTALRHIRFLEAQGIFERTSHPRDKRISHVRLSSIARKQIGRYLMSILASRGAADEPPDLKSAH